MLINVAGGFAVGTSSVGCCGICGGDGGERSAPGLTRLIPVAWEGGVARVIGGHRAAFLRGAALADALAAIPPGWVDGTRVPLLLTR